MSKTQKDWMEKLVKNYRIPEKKGKRILTEEQLEHLKNENKK